MMQDNAVSFDDTRVAFSYKSDRELKKAHFVFSIVNHPVLSSMAIGAVKLALTLRLPVRSLIRTTVFEHFCGGRTIDETESTIHHLARFHVHTILDYSVEGEKTELGFETTTREILKTLEKARVREQIPFCVFKISGIGNAGLLERVQNSSDISDLDVEALEKIKKRIDKICQKAYEYDVPILVDAEETWIQEIVDGMVVDMMERYNKESAIVFNTYQLYRTDGLSKLKKAHANAVRFNYHLGVKLVRGAYMERERDRAEERGYESPIWSTKEQTDTAFNASLEFCVAHRMRVTTMCGSHNEYSTLFLMNEMTKANAVNNDPAIWFAQLYGMSDNISFNLAKAGYNVAKYVPYGAVESVMPYLFRRAAENTSVAGQSSRELKLIKKEIARRKLDAQRNEYAG